MTESAWEFESDNLWRGMFGRSHRFVLCSPLEWERDRDNFLVLRTIWFGFQFEWIWQNSWPVESLGREHA